MQGGILSIDAAPDNPALLATAGADGSVVLFDRDAGRIRATLTGHTKKVNGACVVVRGFLVFLGCHGGSHGIPHGITLQNLENPLLAERGPP